MKKKYNTNKNLFILLQTIAADDHKQFQAYLQLFYPGKKLALKLLTALPNYYAAIEQHPFSTISAQLFEAVFEKSADAANNKHDSYLSNLMGDLYGYLKEFLVWQEARRPSFETDILWLRALEQLQLDEIRVAELEKIQTQTDAQPAYDAWKHLERFYFHQLSYYNPKIQKMNPRVQGLEKMEETLESFRSSMQAKIECEKINRQNFVKNVVSNRKNAKQKPAPPTDLTPNLYGHILDLLTKQDEPSYLKLWSLFEVNAHKLKDDDQLIVFAYLANYITSISRKGLIEAYEMAFKFYDFGNTVGVFKKLEVINPVLMLNAVLSACRVKRFDWAIHFIKENEERIDHSIREETLALTYSNLYFEKGDYEKALDLLHNNTPPKHSNIPHRLQWEVLLLKAKYELKTITVEDCEKFEIYMRLNRKITGKLREGAKNLASILKKMSRRANTHKKLITEINALRNLPAKDWVLEKMKSYKPL
ncbi:MAG: hypothetical protein IT258_19750 [Saprospiraceae bacterium]|nr:hypothetical protein [Saprospiraceae bacterium]